MFKRFCLTALVLIGVLSMFGATQESQIKLQTVFEKTFSDTIVDVIFDTATVSLSEAKAMGWKTDLFSTTEKAKGEVTISYPKVVFYGSPIDPIKGKVRKINFCKKDGEVIKVLKIKDFEEVIKSKDSRFILVYKKYAEDNPISGWKVYDCEGEEIYEKKIEGRVVPFEISNEGYVVAAEEALYPSGPPGDGFIYNTAGKEVGRVVNPIKVDEGWASAYFSANQDYAIFGFSDTYSKSVVKLVKMDGEQIWEKEIPLGSYFLLRSDKDVGIVSIFSTQKIKPYQIYATCIGWDGKIKWETPLEIGGIMDIKIDPIRKDVFIISWMGYLWRLNGNNGEIEFVYKTDWSRDILKRIDRHLKFPEFISMYIGEKHIYLRGMPWKSKKFTEIFALDLSTNKVKEVLHLSSRIYCQLFKENFYIFQTGAQKIISFESKEVIK